MRKVAGVALLLMITYPATAQQGWLTQVKPCVVKGIDGTTSIGVGGAIALYTWEDQRSAWIDLVPYFDSTSHVVGGFAGVSTEIEGTPLFEVLMKPLKPDCFGVGVKFKDGHTRGLIYGSWHF